LHFFFRYGIIQSLIISDHQHLFHLLIHTSGNDLGNDRSSRRKR